MMKITKDLLIDSITIKQQINITGDGVITYDAGIITLGRFFLNTSLSYKVDGTTIFSKAVIYITPINILTNSQVLFNSVTYKVLEIKPIYDAKQLYAYMIVVF